MDFSEEELRIIGLHKQANEILASVANKPADLKFEQFRKDLQNLAFRIADETWHLPPRPHNIPDIAPFRSTPIPRRLHFRPLRRMARLIGMKELRYLFSTFGTNSSNEYIIEVRKRRLKEYPDNGGWHKFFQSEAHIRMFGERVLNFQLEGLSRTSARLAAADSMGMRRDQRTLIRKFNEYTELCKRDGFVRTSSFWAGEIPSRPQFAIALLGRAKAGRKRESDKS